DGNFSRLCDEQAIASSDGRSARTALDRGALLLRARMMAFLSWIKRKGIRLFLEACALGVLLMLFFFMGEKLVGMKGPLITNDNQPLFGDFLAYWSAGKAVLMGQAAHVHDHDLPTDVVHHVQLELMPHLPVVSPWNSPPQFLLIATGLATMPYV